MSKITVVGSFSMDLTVYVEDFPLDGETIIGKKMVKNPGGKGANQAVACARLGALTELMNSLNTDHITISYSPSNSHTFKSKTRI